jgi:two-component system cell cycle response regulator
VRESPIAPSPSPVSSTHRSDAPSVSRWTGSPPHVLLADGDPVASGALAWLLREQGYQVTSVAERRRLIDALERTRPDLLLVDVEDLGDEGEQLLERVKGDERWRDVPIVVATHLPSNGKAMSVLVPPRIADDYVTKPFRVPELLARIHTQLRAQNELRSTRAALAAARAELERAREDVASNRQIVDILNEVTGELSATEIYRILVRRVSRALALSRCSVVLASPGDIMGAVVASFEEPATPNLELRIDRYPEIAGALESQRAVLVRDVQTDPLFEQTRKLWAEEGREITVRSVAALPFTVDRWRSGVLILRTERHERDLAHDDVEFAGTVVSAAVAAIKRAQALESTRADNRRLEALATTDPLTRLLNRRALIERLSREVDRAKRYESMLTLLLLDIDHFKRINDERGHLVGDAVLRQIGALVEASVRTVDIAARYGGEEFVLILPETSQDGGIIFAERLRESIERYPFDASAEEPLHLTASIGVATFPAPRVDSTEDLFARADEALYRAKSSGRNQVRT